MLVRRAPDLKWRDVTPEPLYLRRREFLAAVPFALGAAGAALSGDEALAQGSGQKLEAAKSQYSTTETATPFAGRHHLQQLLRVRHRQERPGTKRAHAASATVDRHD